MATQQRAGGGEDRLSALPDVTLTRILSHLRTDQAVRTSTLSRRWRRVFAAVPVVDIGAAPQRRNTAGVDHMVSGALLSRDSTAPIRSFRVAGFRYNRPSDAAIDQWIVTALFAGAETLDLDLSQADQPICRQASSSYQSTAADFLKQKFYAMPCRLFTHAAALRRLRLGNCALCLPEPDQPLSLDALETLSLKRIDAPDHALQRLISACPRLTELTIEECPTMYRISVPAHLLLLWAFTMRCCHKANHVSVDAPSLRFLGYKGTIAGTSVLSLPTTWGHIDTLDVDICALDLQASDSDKNRRLRRFVERCTNLTTLRLSQHEKPPFFPYRAPRTMSGLAHLELRGTFHVAALVGILQNTSNLEVLTLVIDRPDDDEASTTRRVVIAPAPRELMSSSAVVECFRRSLRKIHLVRYNGQDAQHRRLAMFLLRKAECADELQVTLAASAGEGSVTETRLMSEMVSWPRNPRTRIMFRHE